MTQWTTQTCVNVGTFTSCMVDRDFDTHRSRRRGCVGGRSARSSTRRSRDADSCNQKTRSRVGWVERHSPALEIAISLAPSVVTRALEREPSTTRRIGTPVEAVWP